MAVNSASLSYTSGSISVVERDEDVSKNLALFQAIRIHDLRETSRLINEGAYLKALIGESKVNEPRKTRHFSTPLIVAINLCSMNQDHIDMVRLLLSKGAPAYTPGGQIEQPLIAAIRSENPEVVDLLLQQSGINVHRAEDRDFTLTEEEEYCLKNEPLPSVYPKQDAVDLAAYCNWKMGGNEHKRIYQMIKDKLKKEGLERAKL